MTIQAILFDLDDTLYQEIDYVYSGFSAVADALLENGVLDNKNEILEKLKALFEKDKVDVFGRFLKKEKITSIHWQQCVEIYRWHKPNLNLSEETKNLLLYCREQKKKIGMITDGRPEGQWAKIEALHLKPFMDEIIVTDELGGIAYRKPCGKAYDIMLDKLSVKPEEAVYIGDNCKKDFIYPKEIGMHSIRIENKRRIHRLDEMDPSKEAEYVVQNVKEICSVMERL